MAVHRAGFFGLGLGVGGSRVVNLKFPENIASLSVNDRQVASLRVYLANAWTAGAAAASIASKPSSA